MKKYVYIAIGIVALVIVGVFMYKTINPSNSISQYTVKDLPLKIDTINVNLNVVSNENNNEIVAKYTNNSQKDIVSLTVQVKLKDTDEVVQIKSNELVKNGATSSEFKGRGPNSGKNEDVEILKYKISLKEGTYLEYDVLTNTYNWS